ncbi:DNA polymerase I [Mediannikoviicoccus vaginalis]|uniref:DNA polymerase I n=1 Tax=Mediannikoviicoccus vaginalis TaxID=2899727 RepID=UPI001EFFB658|nr:DNA polymerase I [Mediannikoviicoccus vaginalis]
MKKKFMIIDGSSLIFRAFYAIRHLTTKDGIFTNGVYGFLSMYYKAIDMYKPDHIAVVLDKSGPTFRVEEYKDYKANRDKAPSELSSQFGILKDILQAMNVCYEEESGYEADDIAGTLSKKASKEGYEVLLVTGDRDYLQLIDENVNVILTVKGITQTKRFGIEEVKEKYGVTPIELIDVKGLMGDSSDNIPGVPGVGEKTALKLIKEYKSIEEVYENIENISGKALKKNLTENKDMAFLSKKLGTIFTEVPVERELDDYVVQEPNVEKTREIFERLEFNSFLKELPGTEKEVKFEKAFLSKRVSSTSEIVKELSDEKNITFHMFYNGDNYIHSNPEYIALKGEDKDEVLIYELKDEKELSEFKELFSSKDKKFLSYHIKSDLYYLLRNGIEIDFEYEDISIMEYLIDPSNTNYEINKTCDQYLNRNIKSEEEVFGKGAKKKALNEVEDKELDEYISSFISVCEDLRKPLLDIIKERDMDKLFYDIENPLVKVLADMENVGFKVDREYLDELGEKFNSEIEELEKSIHDDAGEEFNVNSPKQLGEILFEKMGLPVIKKTKTGYSTNVEVLEKLKGEHEIIEKVLRFRSIKKLQSTYVEGLSKLISEDGRIHSTFTQTIAVTGRISSIDPNLQNIPIRTEEGRLIRKAFISGDENTLVDADYSQIELRVLAHLAQDEVMLESFKEGVDIHAKTASEVFHVDLDKVTALDRSNAKAVNFGIVYGIGDFSLSQDLNITRKEARKYIDNYLNTYEGIKKYMEDIVEQGKDMGYVHTIMNRRRYIPELKSKNFNIRAFGERIALNTPIQGSAADIIKLAMISVHNELKKRNLKSKLVLQVHDELIIDAYNDELDEVKELLRDLMENAVNLDVDLKVDISTGNSWYESK